MTGRIRRNAHYAPIFLAASLAKEKEAVIVPGGDHIFRVLSEDQTMADRVIGKTAEWLADML